MSVPSWGDKLKAFKALGKRLDLSNDGCSNAPDFNFKECCVEHDFYYRNDEGVTGVSRSEADKRLRKCIQKRWRLPVVPWLYWGVVRTVGWMPWRKNQKKIDSGELTKLNTVIVYNDNPD